MILEIGNLKLNLESHDVTRGDEEIHLSPNLFRLLKFMMANKNKVLSRQKLYEAMINDREAVMPETNNLNVHMAYLRKKIERKDQKKLIHYSYYSLLFLYFNNSAFILASLSIASLSFLYFFIFNSISFTHSFFIGINFVLPLYRKDNISDL